MYQEGKPIAGRRKRHLVVVWVVVIFVVLVGAGVIAVRNFLKPDTVIGKGPNPITNIVVAKSSNTKVFNEGMFSLSLPTDWKYLGRGQSIYRPYMWENTADNPGVRTMDIYVDNIPTALGVNQVLPVKTEGNKMAIFNLSGNCAQVTGDKTPGSQVTPAKWENVNYLCDLANYERNVIGTSSPNAINSVTLTGKTAGTRSLFFTYTDNSAEPNYTIFTDALESFRLN